MTTTRRSDSPGTGAIYLGRMNRTRHGWTTDHHGTHDAWETGTEVLIRPRPAA